MNTPEGKRLLAALRGADYAHAGEETAIELALAEWPKNSRRRILDAGCGRGGTAHFLRTHGWGLVTGVDRDSDSIDHAREKYPEVTFATADLTDARSLPDGPFDGITMFNVLYAISDQAAALKALRTVAAPGAQLMIFDYTGTGGYEKAVASLHPEFALWHPPIMAKMSATLQAAGWDLVTTHSLNREYERWYADLVSRFTTRQTALASVADEATIAYAKGFYANLLHLIREGALGGAIFHAEAA